MNEAQEFNIALRKRLQGLKKDIGALSVTTGYHGTGSKSHRYQIWVRLPEAKGQHDLIDLWLDRRLVRLGGVTQLRAGQIEADALTVEETYQAVVSNLRTLNASLAARAETVAG